MIKIPVKVIFFDAAETLFRTRGSVGDIYLQIAKKYGSTAAKEDIDEAFFNAFKKKPPSKLALGAVPQRTSAFPPSPAERLAIEKKWWFDVVHEVFSKVGRISRFEDYFEEVFKVFKGSQGWELFPDTLEALRRLKEKGYSLGMITNFDTRIYEVTRALGIDRLLDTLTLSGEAGAPKPDPLIFKKAVEAHRINPEEAVHVGDSLSDDVEGALNAGLQAILIDRHRLFKQGERYIKIESLDELFYYL